MTNIKQRLRVWHNRVCYSQNFKPSVFEHTECNNIEENMLKNLFALPVIVKIHSKTPVIYIKTSIQNAENIDSVCIFIIACFVHQLTAIGK